MKKVKLTYYLVMLLALISLVSVGFASWSVTDEFSTTTSGMIVVEDVMKVNDYIQCNKENVTQFGYFKSGFVNENGEISNKGTITASITINIDNCKKKFSDCNTLEIDLSLESEHLSIFNSVGNLEMSVELKNGSETVAATNTTGDKLYLTIFDIANFKAMSNKVTINVVYTFEIKNNVYYTTTVYPILIRESFNFVLSAKLTGKVVG